MNADDSREPATAGPETPPNALTARFPADNLTVLAHFYRGEINRSNSWRQRMDAATNWAIVTTTATISVAFSSGVSDIHIILPFASFLVFLLLVVEARRYRFFDVWRTRARMLECHLLVPALCHEIPLIEGNWRQTLADDLLLPSYKMSIWEAIGRRLHRTYIWIFGLLFFAWIVRAQWHSEIAEQLAFDFTRFAWGAVSHWIIIGVVGGFNGVMLLILFLTRKVREATGEIRRKDPNRQVWPI